MTDESKNLWEIWISTGKTNGQYTLHRRLISRPIHAMVREYTYVQNIGRTWERACANADEYCERFTTGGRWEVLKDYHADDEMGSLRHPGKVTDADRFWFGKYRGELISDIVDSDPGYLIYIRDKFTATKKRMAALITYITDLELGMSDYDKRRLERETQRKAEDKAREKKLGAAPSVEEGRYELTLTILHARTEESTYGWQVSSCTKCLFQDLVGNRYWGTLPSAVPGTNEELTGTVVKLRATVQPKEGDSHFGFIKRPHLLGG